MNRRKDQYSKDYLINEGFEGKRSNRTKNLKEKAFLAGPPFEPSRDPPSKVFWHPAERTVSLD